MNRSLLILLAASALLLGCHQDLPPVEPEPPTPESPVEVPTLQIESVDFSNALYATAIFQRDLVMNFVVVDNSGDMVEAKCSFSDIAADGSRKPRTDVVIAPNNVISYKDGKYILLSSCKFFDKRGEQLYHKGYPKTTSSPCFLVRVDDCAVFDITNSRDLFSSEHTDNYSFDADAKGDLYVASQAVYKLELSGQKGELRQITTQGKYGASMCMTDKEGTFVFANGGIFEDGVLAAKDFYINYPSGTVEKIDLSQYNGHKSNAYLFHIGGQIKLFTRSYEEIDSENNVRVTISDIAMGSAPPYKLTNTSEYLYNGNEVEFDRPIAAIDCGDYYVLESCASGHLLVCNKENNSVIKETKGFEWGYLSESELVGTTRYYLDYAYDRALKYDFKTLQYTKTPVDVSQIKNYVMSEDPVISTSAKTYTHYATQFSLADPDVFFEVNVETGVIRIFEFPANYVSIGFAKVNK